jgi:TIR domain-containing protein
MWHQLGSILAKPYTFFAAPDVFISYARSDGISYAEAIAAFLADAKRKFSCHIDQWDTTPGVRIPSGILRAARRCHAAVIVGSPAALASQAVHAEVKELTASKRAIVIIDLPSTPISTAIWYPLIQGIAPVRETGGLAAVLAGKPSQNVCNRKRRPWTGTNRACLACRELATRLSLDRRFTRRDGVPVDWNSGPAGAGATPVKTKQRSE